MTENVYNIVWLHVQIWRSAIVATGAEDACATFRKSLLRRLELAGFDW